MRTNIINRLNQRRLATARPNCLKIKIISMRVSSLLWVTDEEIKYVCTITFKQARKVPAAEAWL